MSFTSGFFDAVESEGVYDRVYNAADFAYYFSRFIANGVYPTPTTGMQVKASTTPNMKVSVLPGDGWINGYYISVDTAETLTIPIANASLNRIDSIIMGLDYKTRLINLYVKSGAISANPVPPALQRDTDLWELELAQVTVQAGAVNITQSAIQDSRTDSSRCGIVAGVVKQIDTTDLFAQYTAAFNEWFTDLKSKFNESAVGYLQSQINDGKSTSIELTLLSNGWSSNKEQTLENSNLVTTGYTYLVGPAYASKAAYDLAKVEAKDVTETGKITFVCNKLPSTSLTVQVLRVRVY